MLIKCFRLIVTIFLFSSCHDQLVDKKEPEKDYLSAWFEQNEDSLHKEFTAYVFDKSLCSTCDTTWGEMAYLKVDSSSYMGRFSLEAQKYCDSIKVTYFYNKYTSPKTRILLSPQYNRKCASALDSIFINLSFLKYFKVEKYVQADVKSDILGFQNGDISIQDIRIKVSPVGTRQTVVVYLKESNKNLISEVEERLPEILFGEEILLKKVAQVKFTAYNKLPDTLLTVQQAREALR